MAEIILRALDGYLDEQADPQAVLSSTFRSAPDPRRPSPRQLGPWLTSWSTRMSSSITFGGREGSIRSRTGSTIR